MEKTAVSFGSYKINIPQFKGSSYQYHPSQKKLIYTLKLKTPVLYPENSTQITNVVYESISTAQLGDLEPENIPKKIAASIRNTQSRGVTQSFLSLSPIVKDEYGIKKK
ncbi:hypothetical protein [Flavobacterium sp. ALD4]|uniref:type IX secretion system sortase PorU, long form n=1 Tax=Flavobacterium sp. ALD4 TaxID=2058314 RepID=UPI00269BF5E3